MSYHYRANIKTHRSGSIFDDLVIFILVILFFGGCIATPFIFGTHGCGPERTVEAKVTRLYVDHADKSSHYMVGTDAGVFEVDNGWWLGVWNADEIYARLREGRRYALKTKGNRVVGLFMQQYPYVIAADEIVGLEKP